MKEIHRTLVNWHDTSVKGLLFHGYELSTVGLFADPAGDVTVEVVQPEQADEIEDEVMEIRYAVYGLNPDGHAEHIVDRDEYKEAEKLFKFWVETLTSRIHESGGN